MMRHRLFHFVAAAALAACGGRGAASATPERARVQPLTFISIRGSDSGTVRYRGVAYVRRNEIDVVLREGRMPRTGPFSGAFRGFSIAIASGEAEWSTRVQAQSDQVDAKAIRFENGMLADSLVFRIRHITPDSLAGAWFVLQEWRLWHSYGTPETAPVEAARSSDVFRPATVPTALLTPNGH